MRKMQKRPIRSGAPLAELVVAIGVFAFAGALALQLFLGARFAAQKAEDLNRAVMTAQTLAEQFKARGGESASFYYDKDWNLSEAPALFSVEFAVTREDGDMSRAEVTVRREKPYPFLKEDGEPLYRLSTARYEGRGSGR